MHDSLMAEISTLQMSTFIMSDPHNFNFIGSVPVEMLEKVPIDNAILRECQKLPSSGVCPMPADLRKLIDESNKPKCGGKRKEKVSPSERVRVTKKTNKPTNKLRSPSPDIQEESDERTLTEPQEDDTLQNEEEDTTATLEPTLTKNILKVSSPPYSSIPTSNIFYTILQEPFLNLTTTPPPPPVTPPTSPTASTIPIS